MRHFRNQTWCIPPWAVPCIVLWPLKDTIFEHCPNTESFIYILVIYVLFFVFISSWIRCSCLKYNRATLRVDPGRGAGAVPRIPTHISCTLYRRDTRKNEEKTSPRVIGSAGKKPIPSRIVWLPHARLAIDRSSVPIRHEFTDYCDRPCVVWNIVSLAVADRRSLWLVRAIFFYFYTARAVRENSKRLRSPGSTEIERTMAYQLARSFAPYDLRCRSSDDCRFVLNHLRLRRTHSITARQYPTNFEYIQHALVPKWSQKCAT